MPQVLTQNSIVISPQNLEILQKVGDKVQADIDRMQPFLQHMVEVQQKLMLTYKPIFESIHRVVEATRPIFEASAQLNSIVKYLQPPAEPELYINRISHIPRPINYIESDARVSVSPVRLPPNAGWNKVKCDFMDSHTLTVWYDGQKIGNFGHETLGFARLSTTDHKPDKQWELLRWLAIISSSNNRVRPTFAVLFTQPAKNIQACYKLKHNLAKKLKSAFGLSEDPFYKYDDYAGYRLKFSILPERDLRGNGELRFSGSPLYDREIDPEEED